MLFYNLKSPPVNNKRYWRNVYFLTAIQNIFKTDSLYQSAASKKIIIPLVCHFPKDIIIYVYFHFFDLFSFLIFL